VLVANRALCAETRPGDLEEHDERVAERALCTFGIWSYEVGRLGPGRTIDSRNQT